MWFKPFIWITLGTIGGLIGLVLLNIELYEIMSWDLIFDLEFDIISII